MSASFSSVEGGGVRGTKYLNWCGVSPSPPHLPSFYFNKLGTGIKTRGRPSLLFFFIMKNIGSYIWQSQGGHPAIFIGFATCEVLCWSRTIYIYKGGGGLSTGGGGERMLFLQFSPYGKTREEPTPPLPEYAKLLLETTHPPLRLPCFLYLPPNTLLKSPPFLLTPPFRFKPLLYINQRL
jgi:hypothetical protein